MLNSSGTSASRREQLSALMDGEIEPLALPALVAAWRDEPDARAAWHAYHLMGDVMRSQELAARPAHDDEFLRQLRVKLAAEPVPLATTPMVQTAAAAPARQQPVRQPRLLRRGMMAPVAVAAGFVAVAGMLVVFRVGLPSPAAPELLASPSPSGGATTVSGLKMVRDVRLDRYLSAHRKQANGLDAPGATSQQVQIVYEGQ